ncbi:PE family protein, partial [Mycobacterium szulgai]|nr:PE family protein [Mycobacterium szulgai]
MSFVLVAPASMAAAATDLANIGSAISAANGAAAASTAAVATAAGDEVSAAIAALFSGHGRAYQALAAQVATLHEQIIGRLSASGNSYAAAELTNVNSLAEAVLGRPLVGNRRDASTPGGRRRRRRPAVR